VAALAYILLPISGLIAYFAGRTARMRLHGLQAVVLGAVWPVALYAGSAVSARVTQITWALGALLWVVLMGAAAFGRDLRLPLVGSTLQRVAAVSPKGH
jgi:uncharacterized membrane protein